jgi:methionine biosynthesis protein MetW
MMLSCCPFKDKPNSSKDFLIVSTQKPDNPLRFDLSLIAGWIEPGSKVLDLGCGEGELLHFLKKYKQVACSGIEKNEANAARCIEKGLAVIQGDINVEILDYADDAFDYVILSQTLQQVYEPSILLQSLLRIGKKAVVSFPNFSHWQARYQLLVKGKAPVTSELPYEWHNTPNIRVITLKDFRAYSKKVGFSILNEVAIQAGHEKGRVVTVLPDLLAAYGIFLIGKA